MNTPPSRGFSIGCLAVVIAVGYGLLGAIYLFYHEIHHVVPIPTLNKEISAYQIIKSTDIETRTFAASTIASGTLTQTQALVGSYALQPLAKHTPLRAEQVSPLTDTARLAQTATVSIILDPNDAVGNTLRVGELVDLFVVRESAVYRYDGLLVVNIFKPAPGQQPADQPEPRSSIVVAVPVAQRDDVVLQVLNGKVLFSRVMQP